MNKFDVQAFLDDEGVEYTKAETTYKGKPCTKYTLKHCPFDESHLGPDSVIFQYENGNIAFVCLHDSCRGKKWVDVKALFPLVDFKKYWSGSEMFTVAPGTQAPGSDITYLSGADVILEPVNIDWIIFRMLAAQDSVLFHASGGLGKSMFILFLILCLGSDNSGDKPFLTDFSIPKRRCALVIGAENGRSTTYRRLKNMVSGSPEIESGLKNIFFMVQYDDVAVSGQNFLDPVFCVFLVGFIRDLEIRENIKIEVLIIDPLISFSGVKNENDAGDMRPSLDAIDRVCRQVKCTPVVIHHDKKDGENFRGSSAVNDWCRNRISLKREFISEDRITGVDKVGKPIYRSVRVPVLRMSHEKCNNFAMFPSFLLRMTESLTFEKVSEQLGSAEAEKIKMVVNALVDMGGFSGSTNALAKQVSELSGVSESTAKKYIGLAVDEGRITRLASSLNGSSSYSYEVIM